MCCHIYLYPLVWDKLQLLVTYVPQVIWKTAPSAICVSCENTFSDTHFHRGKVSALTQEIITLLFSMYI